MSFSAERLDALIGETEEAVGLLDEIEHTLAAVQTDEGKLSVVTRLFATELAKTWSDLDSTLSNKDTWETIDTVVVDVQDFLEDLHEIVLSPRRTELQSRVNRWLETWSVDRNAALEPFLENADDENLTRLEDLADEIEPIEINQSAIQQHVAEWISHRVKELAQTEKKVALLEIWLEELRQVVSEADELDGSLRGVSVSIESLDHDLLQLMAEKWLECQLAKFSRVSTKQDNPDYASWKGSTVAEWEAIEAKLRTLKPTLVSLSLDELGLVRKDMERRRPPTGAAVGELTSQLGDLIRARQVLTETPQLQTDGSSLKQPAMKSVRQLWDERPSIPDPLQSDDLENYIGELHETEASLADWLQTFSRVSDQLDERCSSWKELAAAHDLEEAVKTLEGVDPGSEDLGDLACKHNSLLEVVERIRHRLKQGLPEDEKEILGVIIDRLSRGHERLNALDLETGRPFERTINLLARLGEKNLVRIEVTTWRSQP